MEENLLDSVLVTFCTVPNSMVHALTNFEETRPEDKSEIPMPSETPKMGSTEVIVQVSMFFLLSRLLYNEAADKLLCCNFCAAKSAEALDGE